MIIGTPRGGTTALWAYLRDHPEVFVPDRKELNYFTRPTADDERLARYLQKFAGAEQHQVTGEASPRYLADPDAAHRMQELVPAAKLLAILRDPVDRAYSHYWFARQWRAEERTFAQAVKDELDGRTPRGIDYLQHGLYAQHLERFTDFYPRESICVLMLDDLKSNPTETFKRACDHIGITEHLPDIVGEQINAHRWVRSARIWRAGRRWRGRPGGRHLPLRWLDSLNSAPFTAPPLDPELREELRNWFAKDDQRLADWLGSRVPWR